MEVLVKACVLSNWPTENLTWTSVKLVRPRSTSSGQALRAELAMEFSHTLLSPMFAWSFYTLIVPGEIACC